MFEVEDEKSSLLSSKKQKEIDEPFPKNVPKYTKILLVQIWSQSKKKKKKIFLFTSFTKSNKHFLK